MAKKKLLTDEEIQKYKNYIHIGKKFSEDEFQRRNKEYKDFYKIIAYKQAKNIDRVSVPEIFSAVRTILPSIFNQSPTILATANRSEVQEVARVAEAVANYQWRKHNVQSQVELALIDFLLMGWGVVKTAWQYETQTVKSTVPKKLFGIKTGGTTTEEEEYVISDNPFVQWVDPFTLYVSPDAKDLNDSTYVIQELIQPLEKVKGNPEYSNTKDLKPTKTLSDKYVVKDEKDEKKKKHLSKVVLHEIYLRDTRKVITLAEGHDEPLSVKDFPYSYKGFHPFDEIRNYIMPGEFYPFGEARTIESQQKELNTFRSMQLNQRKRFNRKVLVEKRAGLDEEAREALVSSDEAAIIDCISAEGIVPLDFSAMQGEIYKITDDIKEDITRATGISEYMRAAMPETKRTATEANMVQGGAQARPKEKLKKVEEFSSKIARKLIGLSQQYFNETQVVRIVDDEGTANFVKYTGAQIKGDFDLDIEIGSTQPKNTEMMKQQALEMHDRFKDDRNFSIRELDRTVLEAFNLDKNDKLMVPADQVPPPPPPEVKPVITLDSEDFSKTQIAALMQKLQLEVPMDGSPTNDQETKIVSEQAKARHAQQEDPQIKQAEFQMDMAKDQQGLQIDQAKGQGQIELLLQKIRIEQQKAQQDMAIEQEKALQELSEMKAKMDMELEEMKAKADLDLEIKEEAADQAAEHADEAAENEPEKKEEK